MSENQVSRIRAIVNAAEEVIGAARQRNDSKTEKLAKETAYDRIRDIVQGYPYGRNDWQE